MSLVEQNSAPKFSLNGLIKQAKITRVIDGDTVIAIFPFNDDTKFYTWCIRLSGIDTPEIRSRNKFEKKFGLKVKKKLEGMILYKIVTLHCGDFDSFGRLLGEIFLDEISVNKLLVENGFAFEYNGGKKHKFWGEFLKLKLEAADDAETVVETVKRPAVETVVETVVEIGVETVVETPAQPAPPA